MPKVGGKKLPSYDAGGRVKRIKGYGDGGKVKVDVKKEVEKLKPKNENELKHYKKWREDKDWYEEEVKKDSKRQIFEHDYKRDTGKDPVTQKQVTLYASTNKKKKGGDYA